MGEVAGRLAEMVQIERWQALRDAAGDDGGAWVTVGRAYAGIRPDGALAPAVGGAAARSGQRWQVLMRDAEDLGLEVRLRWRGAALAVLAVKRDPATPGLVSLLCEGKGP